MASHIFSFVNEDDIRKALTSFQRCTGLSTQLIDDGGRALITLGSSHDYCNEFRKHLPAGDTCSKQHFNASMRAVDFGSTYIFCCHSGLYHMAYPLMTRSTFLGSVIVGPFLMDTPGAEMILDIEAKYNAPSKALLRLAEYAQDIPVITPEKTNAISDLLFYLINSLVSGSRELQSRNREKLVQQSKINESIQMYKQIKVSETLPYPMEKEKKLIDLVKAGNIQDAREIFNDLLGYILLYEHHNMGDVKIRIVELCTLLSRAAVEKGANPDHVFSLNNKLIKDLLACKSIDELGFLFQDNMDIFTDSLFYTSAAESDIIRSATAYISEHFSEDITLTALAEELAVNVSYLSTLFKNITGNTFNEHLNKVRIDEAKRLLMETDFPILEISVACGFNDQSYFTKVFKKYTGLTPKQIR